MPTISQMLRHRTHTGSNEQGLYTCTAAASIFVCFVFSWRCTTRPWTAMKVMLVVQSWKCVTGGRLRFPAWNLQSPHRVQDRGPAQEQQRRGEGERPLETHRPSTRGFGQIWFHSEMCVTVVQSTCYKDWAENSITPDSPVGNFYSTCQKARYTLFCKRRSWPYGHYHPLTSTLVSKLMIWKVHGMVNGSLSELWDNKDKLVEALDFYWTAAIALALSEMKTFSNWSLLESSTKGFSLLQCITAHNGVVSWV